MSEKRRDHRGRILHNGEIQLSDGRYRFKYVDEMGKERAGLYRFGRWRRKSRQIILSRLQQMAEI